MIILEGPNGTGKSTLAETLAKGLGFTTHKFTHIPETQFEFEQQVEISLELTKKSIIQDRTPLISEFIYANYNKNRKPFYTPGNCVKLLKLSSPILIFCDTESPNPVTRPHDHLIQTIIENTYLDFFDFLKIKEIDFVKYDYKKDTIGDLLCRVLKDLL